MSISLSMLKKAALEGRLAHLLLFHGSGTKERDRAVLELALMLNCKGENKPCGECPACKKIMSGNHPDVHVVRPLKTSVGIEQIIALQEKIYRKTYEEGYRVCLIDEADKLSLPAANALLKIAEEPPANTIIILSSANAEKIISTLQSRAQIIYFPFPTENQWGDEAEAFQISGRDPDLARKIQEYGVMKVSNWLEIYLGIIQSGNFLDIFSLFPMEREECLLFLQTLAVKVKGMVVEAKLSPQTMKEISKTIEAVRKQANYRLALEVLALKHLKLGGNGIG